MAMFNHGNVRIPPGLDRILRCFVVTPDMHRVHHSVIIRETNSNYGFNLSWWDRLFGTFQEELEEEPVIFGIRGAIRSWNPVKALTHIYVDMAQDSWRTARCPAARAVPDPGSARWTA